MDKKQAIDFATEGVRRLLESRLKWAIRKPKFNSIIAEVLQQ